MRSTGISLIGALLAVGLLLAVAATSGATAPSLTSSLSVVSAPSQVTFNGSPAIKANYTNSPSVPSLVLCYLVVHNSAGQTIGIFLSTASVASGQIYLPFYVVMFGLPSGHYTGTVFVVTSDWVPLSTESTVSITL